jgi:hypothetical protein
MKDEGGRDEVYQHFIPADLEGESTVARLNLGVMK